MPTTIIDQNRCIRCNTCATVCVQGILDKATGTGFPSTREGYADYCLRCGHCQSFCEQNALTLDYFPEEKIILSPTDGLIEANNLALYMKKRRSVRHFTSKPVDKEVISKMIDTARYAASGGNSQPVKWLVIYDQEEVQNIARLTIDWMRTIVDTSHPLAAYVPSIISKWDNGIDFICHNAPHLLFALTPLHGSIDGVIAMTHFDIAAPSFGIGTCWAGFVNIATNAYKPIQDLLSLPGGYKVEGAMMFGYSRYKVASIPQRNRADITWK
jgi:nitroreductase/ferredoxin